MLVADFDYDLPKELIAQQPLARRDASRMLVLERSTGKVSDAMFSDIGQWLREGDLLVLNNTRVIPARVFGKLPTGGTVELLLLRQVEPGVWEALSRPSRKARPGAILQFGSHNATIVERKPEGIRLVRFDPPDVSTLQQSRGEVALPPYIEEKCGDYARYQTVFAQVDGAIAAPTAGLHFTPELLRALGHAGVETAFVTLHAGLGTFRPVKAENIEEHAMHPEEFELSEAAAGQVNRALSEGRRIVCVGTTTVRVLEGQAFEESPNDETRMSNTPHPVPLLLEERESEATVRRKAVNGGWRVKPGKGQIDLYIYPGYEWKVVGALLTNFHLPKSTLLMLVSALAGRDAVLAAYRHAVEQRYRFYSFGDAMLVV
ncbi:tRNA preQ1(34) S-adenosylmethionine ribosyltransferase-isomerase QueA [candidate division WOR-3 bacterium]|uniref:S-adenosylmethionine:tRNA ribosyltransferase-isomerase n=1 Tax=candidate division WOR-3 bacterium TaxID=2052148 RepID=A0A937XEH3_UNCW3|nr:tRNA preQ1(34) S-adenosylmethionine ribosyltransferase-isomerase QueA [candidate division WOR-3 bacterium]